VAAKPSTPWSIQCQIAYRLQQQARGIFVSKNDSKPETYNACLQLALCYHIGFGVRPNRESTFDYLNLSVQGNETSRAIYRRAASVLKSETHDQALVLDYQTDTDKKLEAYESSTNYFSTRIRLYHQSASPNNASASKPVAQSERLSLGTFIDMDDLDQLCQALEKFDFSQADVSAALTRACQDGNAELALKLCSYCKTFVLNADEPNPLHWLIMFDDETVGRVSYALVSGSHGQPGPCQLYINAAPKAGRGIFFHPEHCMELFGTPMHWAVRTRNLKLVLILEELGADINIRWSGSQRFSTDVPRPALPNLSPLDIAVAFHLSEITAELLDLGAERSGGSFEEIHSAFLCIGQAFALLSRYIIHGEGSRQAIRDTIKVLVENGFDICETDSNGYDPILVALRDSNCEGYIIEELIAAGARLDRSTFDDQSNAAILIAQNSASCRYKVANLELVSPYVVDINASDTYGRNALHYASIGGSEAMIEALSGVKGFDVHAKTRLGQTALHLAATFGNANAVSCLFQIGANLEDVDSSGMTALQLAAVHRKIEVANVLINVGAEVSFKSKEGDKRGTVLHFSTAGASSGDTISRPLIEAHASLQSNEIINATDSSGWTAMHKAAYFGDFSAVHALLDYHADFSLKDTAGRTALDLSLRLLKRIETHGLGIDHDRIRRRGEHAVDCFVDCLLEIKASLEDHQKA
jgi:ankyrin repeat protein